MTALFDCAFMRLSLTTSFLLVACVLVCVRNFSFFLSLNHLLLFFPCHLVSLPLPSPHNITLLFSPPKPSVEALDRARDLCVSLVERIRALELERLLQPQDKRSDHATTGNKGAGNGAAPTPPAGPPPSSRDAPKHDQEEEQPPKRRRRGFREAEEYTEPPVVAVNLERAPAAAVPPLEPVPPPAMPMKKPEVPPFSDAAPLQGSASGGTASSASFGMAPPAPRQPASSSSSSMMPPPPRKTNSSMAPPPPMLPRKAAASAMGPPPSAAKPPVESKGETGDKTGAVQGLVAYGDEEDSN